MDGGEGGAVPQHGVQLPETIDFGLVFPFLPPPRQSLDRQSGGGKSAPSFRQLRRKHEEGRQ